MAILSTPNETHEQLLLLSALRIISSCPNQSWTHIRGLPLRVLTDLLERYIYRLGVIAKTQAELGGRTLPNASDAVAALSQVNCSAEDLIKWIASITEGEDQAVAGPPNTSKRDVDAERVDRLRDAGSLLNGG